MRNQLVIDTIDYLLMYRKRPASCCSWMFEKTKQTHDGLAEESYYVVQ